MKSERLKKIEHLPGETGLPPHYPSPDATDDLLFYIQRNQNENTVIYEVNRNSSGLINLELPMVAYWIQYSWGGKIKELNPFQTKLAFGYSSQEINHDLIQFHFVSYPDLHFYIVKEETSKRYKISYDMNGQKVWLNNIYAFAYEMGVFPVVKYIELYGEELETGLPVYEKITIEQ